MRDTVAIIPARKNSKRLKNKNIIDFFGKPMIYYSISAALKSKYISEVLVSTDSKKIKKIAENYGAKVPYLRKKKLSNSNSKTIDVIKDLFEKYISKNKNLKKIILLQPTSPLRDCDDIDKSISLFNSKKADYVTSLCETKPKNWFFQIKKDQKIKLNDFNQLNKVEKTKNYLLNGAIYIYDIEVFKKKKLSIKKPFAYIMKNEKFVDIDNSFDLNIAKFLKRHISNSKL